MVRFIQYTRWLSLGIPTGAIFVLALIARELHIFIPKTVYLALFSAVWLIYLMDHWLDSRRNNLTSERRKFHQRNQNLLMLLMGLSVVVGMLSLVHINPTTLRNQVFLWGLILSAVCGVYLLVTQWLGNKWLKEFTVAGCYAMGICLVPVILVDLQVVGIILLQTFLLAWLNLITFSIYELHEDQLEGFYSIATKFGKEKTTQIAIVIILLLATSLIIDASWGNFSGFIIIGMLIYTWMLLLPGFFKKNDRFRILGDAVFWLAAIFLLF